MSAIQKKTNIINTLFHLYEIPRDKVKFMETKLHGSWVGGGKELGSSFMGTV